MSWLTKLMPARIRTMRRHLARCRGACKSAELRAVLYAPSELNSPSPAVRLPHSDRRTRAVPHRSIRPEWNSTPLSNRSTFKFRDSKNTSTDQASHKRPRERRADSMPPSQVSPVTAAPSFPLHGRSMARCCRKFAAPPSRAKTRTRCCASATAARAPEGCFRLYNGQDGRRPGRLRAADCAYVVVLTHPTTGGVRESRMLVD